MTSEMTYEDAASRYRYDGQHLYWLDSPNHPSAKRLAGRRVGCKDDKGYYVTAFMGRAYKVHRIIWLMVHGEWPKGIIDHINRDPSDNRIENMRVVGHSENQRNRKHCGKVDYPGVHIARNGKYISNIKVHGKHIHLGTYGTEKEAISARKEAERKYDPDTAMPSVQAEKEVRRRLPDDGEEGQQ